MQGSKKAPDATGPYPLNFPIFQAQSGYPRELAGVVGHEYGVVGAGRHGD